MSFIGIVMCVGFAYIVFDIGRTIVDKNLKKQVDLLFLQGYLQLDLGGYLNVWIIVNDFVCL